MSNYVGKLPGELSSASTRSSSIVVTLNRIHELARRSGENRAPGASNRPFSRQAAASALAALAQLLPLAGALLHARWSGEAGWLPLGRELRLEPENATSHPQPGYMLLYGGCGVSPELLIPYGECAFACRAGALAGNHVLTLEDDAAQLRELGRLLRWKGAQPLELE